MEGGGRPRAPPAGWAAALKALDAYPKVNEVRGDPAPPPSHPPPPAPRPRAPRPPALRGPVAGRRPASSLSRPWGSVSRRPSRSLPGRADCWN